MKAESQAVTDFCHHNLACHGRDSNGIRCLPDARRAVQPVQRTPPAISNACGDAGCRAPEPSANGAGAGVHRGELGVGWGIPSSTSGRKKPAAARGCRGGIRPSEAGCVCAANEGNAKAGWVCWPSIAAANRSSAAISRSVCSMSGPYGFRRLVRGVGDKRCQSKRVISGIRNFAAFPPRKTRLRDAGSLGDLGLRETATPKGLDQVGGFAHVASLCEVA